MSMLATHTATAASKLSRVLEPGSIAIIGASATPGKRGFQILQALRDARYVGAVYPVNPKGGKILDYPVLADIAELPQRIDLALIARPAREVAGILRALGDIDAAGAVVLANGYEEAGSTSEALIAELRSAIAESGVRVIGPNTSGIINFGAGADLVGLHGLPASGSISVITQSGNMLLSMLADVAMDRLPGLDVHIGLGNQIDVGFEQLLTELVKRETTKAVALHIEGFTGGRRFLATASDASRACPIVALRGGRSKSGAQTALSHTGSIAGSDEVATAVLQQAGITLVQRSDELAVVAGVLATTPLPALDRGVVVLSDGGGHATLAADALDAAGVALAELAPDTQRQLKSILGSRAVVSNPIDVASAIDAYPEIFNECIEVLMSDRNVGLVLVVGLFGGYHLRFDPAFQTREDDAAHRMLNLLEQVRLPVLIYSCYAHENPRNHRILQEAGIPVIDSIDHAVRGIEALYTRSKWLSSESSRTRLSDHTASGGKHGTATPRVLSEVGARELLHAKGISTGPWRLTRSASEARDAVSEFDCPCALKIVSRDAAHKSDLGGVHLNVVPAAAERSFIDITHSVRKQIPDASIDGVLVSPMVEAGVELLVGINNDPLFGPVLAFGTGGVMVEAADDVTFRTLPMTRLEAREMIAETRVARLLSGYRHLPVIDLDLLAGFLVRVGDAACAIEGLKELDLNPVIANGTGLHIVDVLISTMDD